MKKILPFILIGLGVVDLLLWVVSDFESGWLELVVGQNFLSQFGAWILIGIGVILWKKQAAIDKSDLDTIADLDSGESVIHRQVGGDTIVTITNKKIIYRNFGLAENFVKLHNNVLVDEKAVILLESIESVRPVKTRDTAKSKIGGIVNVGFGIQLLLKNGELHNLPITKPELLCAHISKLIKNENI